jgi:hypothetical protein
LSFPLGKASILYNDKIFFDRKPFEYLLIPNDRETIDLKNPVDRVLLQRIPRAVSEYEKQLTPITFLKKYSVDTQNQEYGNADLLNNYLYKFGYTLKNGDRQFVLAENYFYPINKAVDHYKQVAERLLKTDSVSAYDKIAIKYHLSQYKYLNDDIEAMSYNTYELKKVLDYAQTAEHNDQFIFKEGVKKLYYLSHIDNAVQIFTISIPKGYRKDCKYPLFLIFSTFRNSFDAGLYSNYLDRPIIAADITGRGFTLGSYIGEAVIWDLIDHIKSVFSIDTDKIYATGVSNGAAAVWAQSEMYPDRFAGIFPVSGPVNSSLICNLKDLPVINVSSKTEELYAWAYKSVHEKLLIVRYNTHNHFLRLFAHYHQPEFGV